jgi:hypothetical protein
LKYSTFDENTTTLWHWSFMASVAFGTPFPFAIQAYLWVMHGAAFALAFFFGAGLFVRSGSFVGAAAFSCL